MLTTRCTKYLKRSNKTNEEKRRRSYSLVAFLAGFIVPIIPIIRPSLCCCFSDSSRDRKIAKFAKKLIILSTKYMLKRSCILEYLDFKKYSNNILMMHQNDFRLKDGMSAAK
uniref:Uncharacterized protein n=1 Tax=Romanomermis culicivorax TaxID=13658 RepID=A0A915KIQ5_ROMCU